MIIYKKAIQLGTYIKERRKKGLSIGMVPTMGALHEGHLSLIEASVKQNQVTVCSIFINPTQFNNPEDLRNYPVSIEKDIELLITAGCQILFLPEVKEIYNENYIPPHYELGPIEHVLEGHYRPGHFQGVCQVVDRLLEIVEPDKLYLGQKDFQQCMVVRKLLELTNRTNSMSLHIIPTVRESDGLAMSSRNRRLDPDGRKLAPAIFHELAVIRNNLNFKTFEQLEQDAKQNLENNGFGVDYIQIVNANNLAPAQTPAEPLVAVVAAHLGKVRLIDNLILN